MALHSMLLVSYLAANAFAQDIGTYTYTTPPNINTSIVSFNSTADATASLIVPGTSLISIGSTINYALTLAISENTTPNSSTTATTESLLFLTTPTNSGFDNPTLVNEWMNCAWVYERVSLDATNKGQKDDGSCDLTLGKDCVNELLTSMASKNGTSCESRLQGVVVPEACEDALGESRGNIFAVDLATSLSSLPEIPVLLVTSPLHSPFIAATYAEFTTRIWPVIFFQMKTEGAGAGRGTSHTAMVCLNSKNGKPLGEGGFSSISNSKGAHGVKVGSWEMWLAIFMGFGIIWLGSS